MKCQFKPILLSRLELVYPWIWGAHEICGHGGRESLELYDKYTYFTKEEEAER